MSIEWESELVLRDLLPPPWRGDGLEPNRRVDYVDKYRGVMVGTGVGDALGCPAEGWSAENIRDVFGTLRDYRPDRRDGLVEITDDTSLTVAIAQSVVENGWLEPEDLARRFAAWRGFARGIGNATWRAISNYESGAPWWRAGEESAGNGAAMRTAPIGLLHSTDIDGLRRDAALAAVVTHADPMAVASAVAQSWAVAYLVHVEPGRLDVADFLQGLERVLGDVVDTGHVAVDGEPDVRVRLLDRLLVIGDRLDASPGDLFAFTRTSAFVLESLPAALWCFLRAPGDPEEVIVTAANAGGDTDTIAAMAGALAGAYLGERTLPPRWFTGLEYIDGLEGLGERLLALSGLPGASAEPRHPAWSASDAYSPVRLDGREYPTLTHLQCAAAAPDPKTAERLRLMPMPEEARRLAQKLRLTVDTAEEDVAVLESSLRQKRAD